MPTPPGKPMSWPVIIGIMVAIGIVTGMLLGGLGPLLGLPVTTATPGVGAAMGVSGAILITRRKAQIAQLEQAKRARADEPKSG